MGRQDETTKALRGTGRIPLKKVLPHEDRCKATLVKGTDLAGIDNTKLL